MKPENYRDHVGLWSRELREWVPARIFDAHVHLGRSEDLVRTFTPDRLKNALCTRPYLTLEEMDAWHRNLYSGKSITDIFAFPFPLQEADYARANAYIVEAMRADSRIHGFVWTDPRNLRAVTTAFTAAEKCGVRFIGAKPYYDMLEKSNFVTAMTEILPRPLLEFINAEGLLLMLHTTGRGVGDAAVRDCIRFIAETYPRIRIILAHMGRHLQVADFEALMQSDIPELPTVYLEMSSSSEPEIYRMTLLESRLHGKLLFGSDIPFGLITGVEQWSETAGAIFRSRDRYTWSEEGSYGYELTYNTYHVLKALKDAMDCLDLSPATKDRLKHQIFHDNAATLIAPSGRAE